MSRLVCWVILKNSPVPFRTQMSIHPQPSHYMYCKLECCERCPPPCSIRFGLPIPFHFTLSLSPVELNVL